MRAIKEHFEAVAAERRAAGDAAAGGAAPAPEEEARVLPEAVVGAAALGKIEEVTSWLDGGGHVDARGGETQLTLLMIASTNGHERLVVLLLARGAAVNLVMGWMVIPAT